MEEPERIIIIVLHDINMASQYADEASDRLHDGQVFSKCGRTDQIMQADSINLRDSHHAGWCQWQRSVSIASNIEASWLENLRLLVNNTKRLPVITF